MGLKTWLSELDPYVFLSGLQKNSKLLQAIKDGLSKSGWKTVVKEAVTRLAKELSPASITFAHSSTLGIDLKIVDFKQWKIWIVFQTRDEGGSTGALGPMKLGVNG